MITGIEIDTREVEVRTGNLIRDVQADAPEVVRDEARLGNTSIMRATPPKKYASGRRTVARDVKRTMETFYPPGDRDNVRNDWLRRLLDADDPEAINQFIRRTAIQGTVGTFDESQHRRQRSSGGDVPKSAQKRLLTTRSDATALRKYRSQEQKKVGTFKSAWGWTIVVLGGTAPKWIARNFSRGRKLIRRAIYRLRPGNPEAFAEFSIQSHPYTVEALPRVAAGRERAMKTKADAILRRRAREFNR